MVLLSVVVCSALLVIAAATDVQQCPGNKEVKDLSQNVQLTPCKKIPCKLKKGINQHITIKFVPDGNYKDLINHVQATVLGVPLPFIGVDGNSVCDKLENEDGSKASCPVTAGQTYVYKDSFPVLSFYPAIEVKIHWSLQAQQKDVTCFEVDARIAN